MVTDGFTPMVKGIATAWIQKEKNCLHAVDPDLDNCLERDDKKCPGFSPEFRVDYHHRVWQVASSEETSSCASCDDGLLDCLKIPSD
jgi:hypothetical protein